MNVPSLCTKIIKTAFAILLIIVPLILTPINYELFEYNKMMAVYALTVVIAGTWIVKMASERKLSVAKTPFDLPIALFFGSQLLSTLFSMDTHVSWTGFYSRFNGGMWSVISYVVLYYAFVSTIYTEKTEERKLKAADKKSMSTIIQAPLSYPPFIDRLLTVAQIVAAVIALYGVAERMGIDKHLWVQDVQTRVFSTLGQPNWLAAYLLALLPVFWAGYLKTTIPLAGAAARRNATTTGRAIVDHAKRILKTGSAYVPFFGSLLFFLVLLYTRSRTGLLAFAVSDILFWALTIAKTKPRLTSIAPAILVHAGIALIICINGTYVRQIDRYFTVAGWRDTLSAKQQPVRIEETATPSGTLLESGGTESGTIRKYVWEGAINAWKSSPKTIAIGTGTETFAWAFFRYKPVAHNLVSEWDFLYNKAHNEYLNYLATTGILGLGTYLFFIGSVIWWFTRTYLARLSAAAPVKNEQTKQILSESPILPTALFAGWISILITNFFGFSVVIIQVFFFLIPALLFVIAHPTDSERQARSVTIPNRFREPMRIAVILLAIYLIVSLGIQWYADTQFASGYRLNRAGMSAQAEPLLEHAVSLNPGEPLYHDELASALANVTVLVLDGKNASEAAKLAKNAISENTKALTISPENVSFWKTRTKIFYTFSTFDPQFNQMAIDALTKAQILAPNDPKILYNLAILYSRQNDTDRALSLLMQAKQIKPNYRDAYYALSIFYKELNRPDDAKKELTEYLRLVDPGDTEFMELLKQ